MDRDGSEEEWWMKKKPGLETTTVKCLTTASPETFTIELRPDWSPLGVERFLDLVDREYFHDIAMFRCVKGFLVQFGITDDPEQKEYWREQGSIKDDPSPGIPFKRGMLSFAGGGPNTRDTQLFITFDDLEFLGKAPWETPLGYVTTGMETAVDRLYTGYGDQKPYNEKGPEFGIDQATIFERGNAYLREEFPLLSYIEDCWIEDDPQQPLTGPPAAGIAGVVGAAGDMAALAAGDLGGMVGGVAGRMAAGAASTVELEPAGILGWLKFVVVLAGLAGCAVVVVRKLKPQKRGKLLL